jgi:hypothetical protein
MTEEVNEEDVDQPQDYHPQPPATALLPRPPSPVLTVAEKKQAATHRNKTRRTETSPTKKWCNRCLQVCPLYSSL